MKKQLHVLVSLLMMLLVSCSGTPTPPDKDLNVSVKFTGTQIVITNNDVFTYRDAVLEINGDYTLSGYNLEPHETYTVGIMQFANSDGNRFTTLQKPQSFSISCKVDENTRGWYYGSWK